MEARRFWTDRVFRAVLTTAVFSLVTGFAVFSFPSTKADQTNAIDFSTFYCAGLMVRQGFGHRLYSVEDQKHCLSQVGSAGVFYLRPPFESLLFIPLSYFSYPRAYLLWTLTSVLMLVVSAYLIDLLTAASGVITQYTNFRADIAFLLCIFVTFSPFTTSLMLGQDATLVLLIYTLTFVLLVRRTRSWGWPPAGMRTFQVPTGTASRFCSTVAPQMARAFGTRRQRRHSVALLGCHLWSRSVGAVYPVPPRPRSKHQLTEIVSLVYAQCPRYAQPYVGELLFRKKHRDLDDRSFFLVGLFGCRILERR